MYVDPMFSNTIEEISKYFREKQIASYLLKRDISSWAYTRVEDFDIETKIKAAHSEAKKYCRTIPSNQGILEIDTLENILAEARIVRANVIKVNIPDDRRENPDLTDVLLMMVSRISNIEESINKSIANPLVSDIESDYSQNTKKIFSQESKTSRIIIALNVILIIINIISLLLLLSSNSGV